MTMVHADHSCGIQDGDQLLYGGEACGYVIEFSNCECFQRYGHLRDLYGPEIAMLPIGDHYTMSPREAACACNLLRPKTVIPMHFGTFPVLVGRPSELQKLVPDIDVVQLKPGVTTSHEQHAPRTPELRRA